MYFDPCKASKQNVVLKWGQHGCHWMPTFFFETARKYLTWPLLLLQIMYSTGKNNPHCRFSLNHSQKSVMRRRKSNYIYVPHNIDFKTIAITCLYAIPRVYLHASMEVQSPRGTNMVNNNDRNEAITCSGWMRTENPSAMASPLRHNITGYHCQESGQ